MEPRLRPINALIALLVDGDLHTPALAQAGFRLAGLEIPVGVEPDRVVVDVLLVHEESGHLLAAEAKSGANVDVNQARKYATLDPQQTVLAGAVTLPARTPPTVEAVYVCLEEHCDRVARGIEAAGVSLARLVVGERYVRLDDSDAAGPILRQALAAPAVLPVGVPRYVPLDADSPLHVVRSAVRAALVAHLARRSVQVSIATLAEEVAQHLSLYGRGARSRFERVVRDAVREIAAADAQTFAFHPNSQNHAERVEFLRTPEDNDPRGRTQAYQALTRGRAGRRGQRVATNPNQLQLTDLLAELDDDEADEMVSGTSPAAPPLVVEDALQDDHAADHSGSSNDGGET